MLGSLLASRRECACPKAIWERALNHAQQGWITQDDHL